MKKNYRLLAPAPIGKEAIKDNEELRRVILAVLAEKLNVEVSNGTIVSIRDVAGEYYLAEIGVIAELEEHAPSPC